MSDEGSEELMDVESDFSSFPPSPFLFSIFAELPPSPLWSLADHLASPPAAGLSNNDWDGVLPHSLDPSTGKNIEDAHRTRHIEASMVTATNENECYPAGGTFIIKEMIQQALRSVKDSIEQHFLVQVWAPVKDGSRYVLSTSGQPFALDPHSSGLLQYRSVSLMYLFSVDGENGFSGLPGRVFWQKSPEWTPNVKYYTSMEYPRRSYALDYNIQGTLALPVFGPSGQSCVAVLELILTNQKINFSFEVGKVCKALEAVNLRSSFIWEHPSRQISNGGRQAALEEILGMLSLICETYKLPLAQTWVPCMQHNVLAYGGASKKSCASIDGICMGQVCMSTTDVAFYVVDAQVWGFRDACVQHHLQKGQGAPGRAFLLRRPCFAGDVTKFCKGEYPLVHHARIFGLAGCLAVCLRSSLSGTDDYVVEFFLPASCVNPRDQMKLLKCLTDTMRVCFRTLRLIADPTFQEDKILDIIDQNENGNAGPKVVASGLATSRSSSNSTSRTLFEDLRLDVLDNEVEALQNLRREVLCEELDDEMNEDDAENVQVQKRPLDDKTEQTSQRKREKNEKPISLEVLQQYFSGSLKDAAESLGVCPTTMKRVCRQHGISRWPSRKINKVSRTLSRLKSEMESVQGGEDLFGLASVITIPVGSKSSARKKSAPADKNGNDPVLHYSSPNSFGGESSTSSLQTAQQLHLNTLSLPMEELIAEPSPNALITIEPLTPTGMLIQDSRSYMDLMDLNNSLAADESQLHLPNFELANARSPPPEVPTGQDQVQIVTIKANYGKDIIRFRLPLTSCMNDLAGEISKRLKLDIGTFHVKYLHNEEQWVLLACDRVLRECLEVASSVSRSLIRLSVQDTVENLPSSC